MDPQEFNNIYGLTWQEKLDYLALCKCCDRHQMNKPTIFKTWVDNNTPLLFHYNSCNCKCRHIARFICRQTEDYSGVGLPLKNPPTPKSVIR